MAELSGLCRDGVVIKVYSFDGQTVWHDRNTSLFEVGNFLGGGAAGNVYECEHIRSRQHYALKILNPLGYKLMSPALLRKCNIVSKGETVSDVCDYEKVEKTNVWWLINGSTKQFVAAFFSEKQNCLKELSLVQCIQVWGSDALHIGDDGTESKEESVEVIQVAGGPRIYVPSLPPKFADFIRRRNRIFREIRNMRKIPSHTNVIRLEGVLELTQESKCTIFLVMELANGGELFDRIKLDCGAREDTAKLFFQQLLLGVMHCHKHGVCHRDLKPENLLLQDTADSGTILKIADFGFSARFAMGDSEGSSQSEKDGWDGNESSSSFQTSKLPFATPPGHMTSTSLPDESLLRVLKSVVGSPFYVAPEVLQARGYDGPKADVWSLGVILYAMLAGNLPFEQELSSCKRFRLFCKWVREQTVKGVRFWNDQSLEYPQWLFPAKFSMLAKGLIVAMLHPDPDKRVSVSEAMRHPLCVSHFLSEAAAMPTVVAPSLVTFSLLPVAVAAAANVPNNTAIFQSNQIFDSDAWSIPIASAVVTISNSVPIAMANSREQSQQSQAQPMIPQGQVHSDDKHPLAMDVENDEEGRCLTNLSEGNDLEDQANRSRTNAEDRSPRCSDMRHSHSGEHDDLDDGMFYMEEESVCSQRDESNSKTRNNDFSSISDNQPTLTSTSTSLDWNVLRKKSPNIPFPVTRDNTDRNRIDTTPGTSSGVFRDPYLVSQGDIFRDTNRSILSNTNGDAPGFSTTVSPSATLQYLSYSPQQMPLMEPPVAPLMMSSRSIDDLITAGEEDSSPFTPEEGVRPHTFDFTRISRPLSAAQPACRSVRYAEMEQSSSVALPCSSTSAGASLAATHPPSFNDSVKRSTRFITAVPASEVLDKVESILEQVRIEHVQTPIGIIGKIEIYWAAYRIEVWGADTSGPPLCALQLYQMPAVSMNQAGSMSPHRSPASSGAALSPATSLQPYLIAGDRVSPSLNFMSPGAFSSSSTALDSRRFSPSLMGPDGMGTSGPQQLFLAEFVRGQLEIFAFKRFYQWVRQRLSQLVKRDYAFKLLDQQGSPMVDSYLLQRFQQCSS